MVQEIHTVTVAQLAMLVANFKPTDAVAVIDTRTGKSLQFDLGRGEEIGGALDGQSLLCFAVKVDEE